MVIDKWTRTSNNNNLATPLLGHKPKETFSELKKQYNRLQNINHEYKKHSKSPPPKQSYNGEKSTSLIDYTDIRNYIDKISTILFSINQIMAENENYEIGKGDSLEYKEINSILDKILLEYNLFMNNMKEIENDLEDKNNLNINSLFNECKVFGNEINKKLKKEKKESDIIVVEEQRQRRNANNNINRNIDRGQINILTHRREYNNSISVVKNNIHYTIEEGRLSNGIKLSFFFMVVLILLYICYLSLS